MRGFLIFTFSFWGMFFFSLLLVSTRSLFLFWVFLEMGSLCLIPMFFLNVGASSLSGLFSYLVVSSVSSSLVICGVLFEGLLNLVVLGLLVKFGVFPFMGWVYNVVNSSNWYVVWGLSTLLKSPFFIFSFLLAGVGLNFVSFFVSLSFLMLVFLFWVNTYSWFSCWCHMMLSSSASLVAMSCWQSLESTTSFFLVYVLWSTLSIMFMSFCGGLLLEGLGCYFLFSFLLVSLPFSFSMFYKFLLCGNMFSCSAYIFIFWVIYTVSEQFYLLKFLIDCNKPRSSLGVLGCV